VKVPCEKGGKDARWIETGDWGICLVRRGSSMPGDFRLTGVLSSSMSSVAEAAASIRSSQRLPNSPGGSAERAFRSCSPGLRKSELLSFCIRRSHSAAAPAPLDFLLPCPRFVIDCFLGRFGPNGRCRGGSVEDLPGGEVESMEGSISLCLDKSCEEYGALVTSALFRCIGGSSIEDLGRLPPSWSECQS